MTLLLWLALAGAAEPPTCDLSSPPAQPELYVLTASSGAQPFMFVGHASLWLRDPERGLDHVWEFGVINSAVQEPLSSLLLGSLLCSWEVRPAKAERRDYRRQKRTVFADRVDLSPEAMDRVTRALLTIQENKDRQELFHWRQNSCSTKVRDVLDAELGGLLRVSLDDPAPMTARDEVLRHVADVRWAWLGLHLLGGAPTDRPLTWWEASFIPDRMREALRLVELAGDGPVRPLLANACVFQSGSFGPPPAERSRHPLVLWGGGLGAGLTIGGVSVAARRVWALRVVAGALVAAVGLLWGTYGTLGLALWAASDLDDFGPNQHLLVANPLAFGFVGLGFAWALGRSPRYGRPLAATMASLGFASVLLALAPTFQQDSVELVGLLVPPVIGAGVWAWLDPKRAGPG